MVKPGANGTPGSRLCSGSYLWSPGTVSPGFIPQRPQVTCPSQLEHNSNGSSEGLPRPPPHLLPAPGAPPILVPCWKVTYDEDLDLGMPLCIVGAQPSSCTLCSGAPLGTMPPVLKGDFVGPSGTQWRVLARHCCGCLTHCLDFGLLFSAVIGFPTMQSMIEQPLSGLTFLRMCTIRPLPRVSLAYCP